MKVILLIFFLLLPILPLEAHAESSTIIPAPFKFEPMEGRFTLSERSRYIADTALALNGRDYLQQQLLLNAGFTIREGAGHEDATIYFTYDDKLGEEAYTLRVATDRIVIRAGSQSGFFYATMSLMQLMDAEIWSKTGAKSPKSSWDIPACYIEDHPHYRWRGLMLDSARNFFSVDYVKTFIDRMAQYKLNVFHWHLTDDEGWRIEIKAYPLLTGTGAVRGPGTALPFSLYPTMRGPKEKVQKGFYTQKEIAEIVDYAARRSVHILPEIDVPAHAKAAVVSYPELLQDPNDTSRYASVQKVANNTIDPGLESSYTFMQAVIREVSLLFPFEYIHLGGDEIPKGAWQHSPAVAKLKQREHLRETYAVKAYFFTKMEAILAGYDRKLIAWQEVGEHNARLNSDTVIMAWKGDAKGIKAAQNGRKVVMSPASKLYFDQQYVKRKDEPGHTWAGPTDTREVYAYRPTAELRDPRAVKNVIGVHACLWSERLFSEQLADYMTWPRALALSEVAWSSDETRDWNEFEKRAFVYALPRLKSQRINYRPPLP